MFSANDLIEQRFKDFYEEVDKKYPNMFNLGVGSRDGVTAWKVALYRRNENERVCFCIELKKNKISVIYPFYSSFSFDSDKRTKIYKSMAYSSWEKAVQMIKDFEEHKIEWDREYL